VTLGDSPSQPALSGESDILALFEQMMPVQCGPGGAFILDASDMQVIIASTLIIVSNYHFSSDKLSFFMELLPACNGRLDLTHYPEFVGVFVWNGFFRMHRRKSFSL
jgi:hypothetical protein